MLKGTPGATGKTHSEKCRARIYKAMDEVDERIRKQPEELDESERSRRRLDPPAQVSERSLADAGGSRKRPAEVSHERLRRGKDSKGRSIGIVSFDNA